jgi:hypothetical protein
MQQNFKKRTSILIWPYLVKEYILYVMIDLKYSCKVFINDETDLQPPEEYFDPITRLDT